MSKSGIDGIRIAHVDEVDGPVCDISRLERT